MPVNKSTFRPPKNANGQPLITVEELAELTGLSVFHLRERTRPDGRGKKIPATKIGIRLWFDKEPALTAIYGTPPATVVPIVEPADLLEGII